MNVILVIGRVLFALICLNAGVNHITHRKAMVGYAQFKKVPAAAIAVPLSGVLLFLGAVSVILGVYADLGALVLAVLLLVMALKMHDFWNADEAGKQADMISFFKNVSMAGAGLVFFAALGAADKGARVIGPMLTNSLFHK